jgi:hypothetical protein
MKHDILQVTHGQPDYQHKHTPPRASRLPIDVITPPRASDSNFIKEPPKKTSPQQPREAHAGLCQTVDPSHGKTGSFDFDEELQRRDMQDSRPKEIIVIGPPTNWN